MEHFGTHERPFNSSEKEIITKFLKYDKHVPLKISEMVYNADVESEYFEKAGNILGVFAGIAFFYFPIIRQQPGVRRLVLSALPAYGFHWWGTTVTEDMRWTKTYAAYQKFMIYHGQHQKLFV